MPQARRFKQTPACLRGHCLTSTNSIPALLAGLEPSCRACRSAAHCLASTSTVSRIVRESHEPHRASIAPRFLGDGGDLFGIERLTAFAEALFTSAWTPV